MKTQVPISLLSILIISFVGFLGCEQQEQKDILMEVRFIPESLDVRNESARLDYTLTKEAYVDIAIYDSAGGLVEENPQTATKFGIQSIPTMLIFKNSQVVDRLVGVQPKQVIIEHINRYI